jgi:hypothetical protein
MREPLPPDEILERAVALWGRAIRRGGWDNGDDSQSGGMAMAMVVINREAALKASGASRQALVAGFEAALLADLKAQRDAAAVEGANDYFRGFLNVDYGPDAVIGRACEASGMPVMLLPVKSSVYVAHDYVEVRFGYGDATRYHYPLGRRQWLVTSLRGEEMPVVIRAVQEGRLPQLQVENS